MFGLFRSKEERLARKYERIFLTVEMAYAGNKPDVASYALSQGLPILRELHLAGWSEEDLSGYLDRSGLCRVTRDTKFAEALSKWMDALST